MDVFAARATHRFSTKQDKLKPITLSRLCARVTIMRLRLDAPAQPKELFYIFGKIVLAKFYE